MEVATNEDRSCNHHTMTRTGDDPSATLEIDAIIEALGLEPHPEGGRYAETWRAPTLAGERSAGTAIYFLLTAGEHSHWHRVDAAEIWHHYAGAPLALRTASDHRATVRILGTDLAGGQRPQLVVEPGVWQTARSLGHWTLVGCTVAPGFEFSGFELAAPDWDPATGHDEGRGTVEADEQSTSSP